MFKFRFIFILVASFSLPFLVFAYKNIGKPIGFVNDFTNTLSASEVLSLENKLQNFSKESSNEIAIAIVPNLSDDTIENFSSQLFKEWGIGNKKKDNGVLILVAKENHQMRIEVGYGLEGALTDAQSNLIINNVMRPAFRANDFYGGLDKAIDVIIAATKGEYAPEVFNKKYSEDQILEFIFYGIFGLMWLSGILGRTKSWWLGGVLGGVAGVLVALVYGFFLTGLVSIIFLILFGLVLDFFSSRAYGRSNSLHSRNSFWGGQSGGGFGGFGGGHSGGGGASGNW